MRIRDGQGRTFRPAFIAEVPTGRLLWVDQVNGNDVLAVRERMTVPFQSLGAAKTAANAGDTIIVLPGTYDEKDLLKNNVNWHFFSGAIVAYSGASGGIFDTNLSGAVTSLISGHGEFKVTHSSGTGHVVYSFASGSSLSIQCRRMAATNPACVRSSDNSGRLIIEALEDIRGTNSGSHGVSIEGAALVTVRATEIASTSGSGISISAGFANVLAARIVSSLSYGVNVTGGSSGAVNLQAFEVSSGTSNGIYYDSTNCLLTVIGARVKSGGTTSSTGRAIHIASNVGSVAVLKLTGCILLASASGDYAIYAATASTKVQLNGGACGNKDNHANVSILGGAWGWNSAIT